MGYWAYIATEPCGCKTGVCVDYKDKMTAKSVAEFIKTGRTVERVFIADGETVPIARCRCGETPNLFQAEG